jgi:hypothetical protein
MLCKHMKPTSLKPPHRSAIWYSNCCVLEVTQVKLEAVARIAPLLSAPARITPSTRKGPKVAHAGQVQRFWKGSVRCQEGNCDVVLADAAKCQARDDGSMPETVGGPGKRR